MNRGSWVKTVLIVLLVLELCAAVLLSMRMSGSGDGARRHISLTEGGDGTTVTVTEKQELPEDPAVPGPQSTRALVASGGPDSTALLIAAASGSSATNASAQTKDSTKVWSTNTDIEIFSLRYDNNGNAVFTVQSSDGKKVIAPGTGSTYDFSLDNTGGKPLKYTMQLDCWIEGTLPKDANGNDITIPVEVRLSKAGGGYVLGSSTTWTEVSASTTGTDSGKLPIGRSAQYTFEWQWPFEHEDENGSISGGNSDDTALGNAAAGTEITLHVGIKTTAELDDPQADLVVKTDLSVTSGASDAAGSAPVPATTGVKARPGDVITVTVTVTNNGDAAATDIVVKDALTGKEWVIPRLEPGETWSETITYTVTDADADKGVVKTQETVNAKQENPDKPVIDTVKSQEASVSVWNAPLVVDVGTEVTESSSKPVYKPGDTLEYKVKAVNNGDVAVYNITVTDELTGQTWVIPKLNPGESWEQTVTYTVTEEDGEKGSVKTQATATAKPEDNQGSTLDDKSPEMSVPTKKASEPNVTVTTEVVSPEPGTGLEPGDELEYKVGIVNNGDTPVYNVTVTDELTGQTWVIPKLDPGESWEQTVKYTITEEDAEKGSVKTQATATAKPEDNNGQTLDEKSPVMTVPTRTEGEDVPEVTSLEVYNQIISGGGEYKPGDTLEYIVNVVNTGETDIYDITVVDELTGQVWHIDKLSPGESATFRVTYTVTEDDAARGSVVGRSSAYIGPATGLPDATGTAIAQTAKASQPNIAVRTEIISGDPSEGLEAGDVIEYRIDVVNNGDEPVFNITVVDELTGQTWVIERLDPGQSVSFTVRYTITAEDEENGYISGTAGAYIGPVDGSLDASDEVFSYLSTEIVDPNPPMARKDVWSIANLGMAIVTIAIGIYEFIVFLRGREENKTAKKYNIFTGEIYKERVRRRRHKVFDLVPAAGAAAAFLITQDTSLEMVIFDRWSPLMAVILAASCTLVMITRIASFKNMLTDALHELHNGIDSL